MMKKTQLLVGMLLTAAFATAHASEPKIAVTDLTYQEKVSQYFHVVAAKSKSNVKASESDRESDFSSSSRSRYSGKQESSYYSSEGTYTYIERGELRTYTADLKGALIKGGGVKVVQARPYDGKPTEQIYDIIGRIKKGDYPGADYVLFGTVSNIAFREETNKLAMGSSITATLTLDLAVDFSLINTKTYEVKAAFSASGTGQDTKIVSREGDKVVLSRSKVISETSKTLADAAYAELMNQLGVPEAVRASAGGTAPKPEAVQPVRNTAPVTVYK